MADYIKSKGIAGIKLKQEVNKEVYEQSIRRLQKELEQISSAFNVRRKEIDEELSILEEQLKGTREEYKTKTELLKEFETKREVVSSLLSAKEKEYKEFTDKENREKERLKNEIEVLNETLAKEKKEIESFKVENKEKSDYISRLKKEIESLEGLYLTTMSSVNSLNKELGDITVSLKEAKRIISTARLIEIGLENREKTLTKKEDICEVRQRSLERMYERKLNINIKNKFYGKNI
jgi:chromosome segregation ATPase